MIHSDKPLVSIIIPTFNRARIIQRTLDSIISQTYKNWECFVVDDGSTDDTKEVIDSYIKQDKRFKYLIRPQDRSKGANACRNYGFEVSKGELINWFDSDDIMHENKIEEQVNLLNESSSNYVICQSKRVLLNKNNEEYLWNKKIFSENILEDYICFKASWGIGSVLYKRSFLEKLNLKFDEELQQSQEYDFHIRLLSKSSIYAFDEAPLITVFNHEDSISYSKTNLYAKAKSSLKLKIKLLKNANLNLSREVKVFLLKDMYRVFFQSTLEKHFKTAFLAYRYFLKAHFYIDLKMSFKVIKHFIITSLALTSYVLFGKGYRLLRLSIN